MLSVLVTKRAEDSNYPFRHEGFINSTGIDLFIRSYERSLSFLEDLDHHLLPLVQITRLDTLVTSECLLPSLSNFAVLGWKAGSLRTGHITKLYGLSYINNG